MIIGAIGPQSRTWSESVVELVRSNLLGVNLERVIVTADSGFGLIVAYAAIGACYPVDVIIPKGYEPVGEYEPKFRFATHFGRVVEGNILDLSTHILTYYKDVVPPLVAKAKERKIPVRNLYGKVVG